MIKFKKFLKWIDYRIKDSAEFQWQCYGSNAVFFNYVSRDLHTCVSAIVDMKDQTVYEVSVTRSDPDREYIALRWFNPDHKKAYFKEAKKLGVNAKQAWDSINFADTTDKDLIKTTIKTLVSESK